MKRVGRFVNWLLGLRMVPALPIVGAAIALVASLGGAFGTANLPFTTRLALWSALMGWNTIKWVAWLNWRVKEQRDWWPASLLGAVVLNIPLPFEIALAARFFGQGLVPPPPAIWANSLVLAAIVFAVMAWRHPPFARKTGEAGPDLLTRNGSGPARVLAAVAEDHYCRLYEESGQQRLIHARFGDVLRALGQQAGAQIHRGAWVADRAVASARREGRKWEVLLPCGTALRVSASFRNEAKNRGWLAR